MGKRKRRKQSRYPSLAKKPSRSAQANRRKSKSGQPEPHDQGEPVGPLWLESMAHALSLATPAGDSRVKTRLGCALHRGRPSLFVPPDMAELQPASLRYLQGFASEQDLVLVEDRRRLELQPDMEKRKRPASRLATGLSLLMKQTGLPGMAKALSHPHRLDPDNTSISLAEQIQMAAHSVRHCKRVCVKTNRVLGELLDDPSTSINGYACSLSTESGTTVLSHYDSNGLRTIGYSTGGQYVITVYLAGGPSSMSSLWSGFKTLCQADLQFQHFAGPHPGFDVGILFTSFYLDVNQTPRPWWMDEQSHNMSPDMRHFDVRHGDRLQAR